MMWLEWRHTRLPLALLAALGAALGLAYLTHVLRGTSPFAMVSQLGPWANGGGCYLFTGLLKDQESYCSASILFAGRWFDWWAPLLATLIGAYFGSRLNDGATFLRLQPLSAARVLGLRLGMGLLALTVAVLLGAALVSGRGALPLSWQSESQTMWGQFWLGTLLVWLRGTAVLLLSACLCQLLPPAVAALTGIVGSLALLGFDFDPFVQHLTLKYTVAQFGRLAKVDTLSIEVLQQFIASHRPHQLLYAAGPAGVWWIAGGLPLLLALTIGLYQRRRSE